MTLLDAIAVQDPLALAKEATSRLLASIETCAAASSLRVVGIIPFDATRPRQRLIPSKADPGCRRHGYDDEADRSDAFEHGAVLSGVGPGRQALTGRTLARTRIVQSSHMLLEDFILIRWTGCYRGRLRSLREVLTLRIGWTHGRALRSYYVEAASFVDRLQPRREDDPLALRSSCLQCTSAERRALDRIGCGEPPACSPKTLRNLLDAGLIVDVGG
ncbi:hypothetical protein [Methylobacterium sp. E-046]|uniref:hypothetical protein n=1 Tax=Methylobacterium sp. E-046 TaxID=2836576 RepID=UPI001FB9AC2A|nr:hypothetical protein [Methylobacterium sp. E-046]MCJ2098001.1 hypothetical protein [Methylobacterium sp. E-046]